MGIGILRRRRLAVEVTVPTGSTLRTRVASARVTATGRYAEAAMHAASGGTSVEEVDGRVEVHCASGDITVGTARTVQAHASSGKVRIGRATGEVDVHCASGSVWIGVAEGVGTGEDGVRGTSWWTRPAPARSR